MSRAQHLIKRLTTAPLKLGRWNISVASRRLSALRAFLPPSSSDIPLWDMPLLTRPVKARLMVEMHGAAYSASLSLVKKLASITKLKHHASAHFFLKWKAQYSTVHEWAASGDIKQNVYFY
ncbi:unnamed protein product [Thelazia callipaeda]|uniref:Chromo domain-containing protein n=1 Tax=Thelazia callipaeda TaxID=103827 RepID=A0A0N5CND1_THECL|nr:unnamed protein product [Thelazia callipaeda]